MGFLLQYYEKNKKYKVICGFEIDNAEQFSDLQHRYIEIDNFKKLLEYNIPIGFAELICKTFNEKLILEQNKIKDLLIEKEALPIKIKNMEDYEVRECFSSKKNKRYSIEQLRVELVDDSINSYKQAIERTEKYIKELIEINTYISRYLLIHKKCYNGA